MPTITAIEPTRRDPSRVSIFLDGAFAFALADELAHEVGLRVGATIDSDAVEGLSRQDESHRACQAALRFLGARPRSELEVRRRLLRHGFAGAAIDGAIDRLRRLGYLDDGTFAAFWIESRRAFKPRSARLVAQELRQKGVAGEAVDLSDWDDDAAALAAAQRWIRSRRFATPADFERRVGECLRRRGFGGASIRAAIRQLALAREASETAG